MRTYGPKFLNFDFGLRGHTCTRTDTLWYIIKQRVVVCRLVRPLRICTNETRTTHQQPIHKQPSLACLVCRWGLGRIISMRHQHAAHLPLLLLLLLLYSPHCTNPTDRIVAGEREEPSQQQYGRPPPPPLAGTSMVYVREQQ